MSEFSEQSDPGVVGPRYRLPQDVDNLPKRDDLGAFIAAERKQVMFVPGHQIVC